MKTQITHDFVERWFAIVTRTAKLGLQESTAHSEKFDKWFHVWCSDVSGELGEIYEKPDDLSEVGDVLWGIAALSMLNGIVKEAYLEPQPGYTDIVEATMKSLKLLDHGKKVLRDGSSKRSPDIHLIYDICPKILFFLASQYDLDKSLDLLDAKLLKRYPKGYTPEASVNRDIDTRYPIEGLTSPAHYQEYVKENSDRSVDLEIKALSRKSKPAYIDKTHWFAVMRQSTFVKIVELGEDTAIIADPVGLMTGKWLLTTEVPISSLSY